MATADHERSEDLAIHRRTGLPYASGTNKYQVGQSNMLGG